MIPEPPDRTRLVALYSPDDLGILIMRNDQIAAEEENSHTRWVWDGDEGWELMSWENVQKLGTLHPIGEPLN